MLDPVLAFTILLVRVLILHIHLILQVLVHFPHLLLHLQLILPSHQTTILQKTQYYTLLFENTVKLLEFQLITAILIVLTEIIINQ